MEFLCSRITAILDQIRYHSPHSSEPQLRIKLNRLFNNLGRFCIPKKRNGSSNNSLQQIVSHWLHERSIAGVGTAATHQFPRPLLNLLSTPFPSEASHLLYFFSPSAVPMLNHPI
ncbi:hypothetical protein HAX54_029717 [Datura stramonium]|uniref:Uncharacterized protein n=1 Tax=Datura stramonium TaxID=4076 RepID=A0ABS8RKY5_DATST|nr:hypothetical protein [Datura stramonium]